MYPPITESLFDETLMDNIMGEVATLLESLPDQAKVFLTSGDLDQLVYLQETMEEYLIPDVDFVAPSDIMEGHLRGRQGVLLIMGTWLMSDSVRRRMFEEQEYLKCTLRRG